MKFNKNVYADEFKTGIFNTMITRLLKDIVKFSAHEKLIKFFMLFFEVSKCSKELSFWLYNFSKIEEEN